MLAALITEARTDPDFANEYRAQFVELRRDPARIVVLRAIDRGEVPADTDVDLALDLVDGPVYHRLLHGHAPLNDRFFRAVVDAVARALTP